MNLLRRFLLYPIGPRRNPGIDWNERLEADRQRRLQSFELQDWKRRREAALKGGRPAI